MSWFDENIEPLSECTPYILTIDGYKGFVKICSVFSDEWLNHKDVFVHCHQSQMPVTSKQSEEYEKNIEQHKRSAIFCKKVFPLARHIFKGEDITAEEMAEAKNELSYSRPLSAEESERRKKMYVTDKKVAERAKSAGIRMDYKEPKDAEKEMRVNARRRRKKNSLISNTIDKKYHVSGNDPDSKMDIDDIIERRIMNLLRSDKDKKVSKRERDKLAKEFINKNKK